MKNKKNTQISPQDAVRELWARGRLEWKLHSVQKQMWEAFRTQNDPTTVIVAARRSGKSFGLCLLAVEQCIQKPFSIVKYVCPKKHMVKTILMDIMRQILSDCPEELRPEFKHNEYLFRFPNGSVIQMAGTDGGHAESLRGGRSDLWICDEAGFMSDLKYVVNTILAPTTDTTGGRGIIASTPSKTSDHEFITEFMRPALFKGKLIKYTIYDNPLLSEAKIAEIIDRYPLKEEDPEFKREYLCQILSGGDRAVFPEFTKELQAKIVKEWPRPAFFDSYVSMDIGVKDLTVVLFGYYDFRNAVLVIEDEFVQNGMTLLLDKFATDIKKKEAELWTDPVSGEVKSPYMRVADNNNQIMLNQLTVDHDLQFIPTRKDNKDAMINSMRMKLVNEQIIIHPRCKTLIEHIENASWDRSKKKFDRSPDAHHYDAADAALYMVRNVVESKNPFPAGYNAPSSETFHTPQKVKEYRPDQKFWVNMFKTRSSIKSK